MLVIEVTADYRVVLFGGTCCEGDLLGQCGKTDWVADDAHDNLLPSALHAHCLLNQSTGPQQAQFVFCFLDRVYEAF